MPIGIFVSGPSDRGAIPYNIDSIRAGRGFTTSRTTGRSQRYFGDYYCVPSVWEVNYSRSDEHWTGVMGQPSIIELPPRMDTVASLGVEASIGSALDRKPSALILDFTRVTFVSSIGLRALLMTVKRCRKQNTQLTLHSVSPQIVDLFGMSGLSAFLPMYATREAALAAISDDTLENWRVMTDISQLISGAGRSATIVGNSSIVYENVEPAISRSNGLGRLHNYIGLRDYQAGHVCVGLYGLW